METTFPEIRCEIVIRQCLSINVSTGRKILETNLGQHNVCFILSCYIIQKDSLTDTNTDV